MKEIIPDNSSAPEERITIEKLLRDLPKVKLPEGARERLMARLFPPAAGEADRPHEQSKDK